MLMALDLTPVFSGKGRSEDDYERLRPFFFGVLPPMAFLTLSVDKQRLFDEEEHEEFSDLNNPLRAVHWLAPARDELARFQEEDREVNQELALMLINAFERALECNLSPRERAQVWYCLRSLGYSAFGDSTKVLGVLLEYVQDGPILLFASPDRFSSVIWGEGSAKSAAYAEGLSASLALDLCHKAQGFLTEDKGSFSQDMPLAPEEGMITISILTPQGIRVFHMLEEEVESRGFLDFHKTAISLLDSLLESTEGDDLVLENPPVNFDDTKWVYGQFSLRMGAMVSDMIFMLAILALVAKFLYPKIEKMSFLMNLVIFYFLYLLIPLISAAMESSSLCGFSTFGKSLFSLSVVSSQTSQGPTFEQSLCRNLAKWVISPLFCGCGFFWAAFHRYRRTWHDVLGGTIVVSSKGSVPVVSVRAGEVQAEETWKQFTRSRTSGE